MFINLFVDDLNLFSDWKTHLDKLCLCLDKCWECGMSLHPKKCMFIVYSRIILEYIVSNKSKLSTPKKLFPIIIMPFFRKIRAFVYYQIQKPSPTHMWTPQGLNPSTIMSCYLHAYMFTSKYPIQISTSLLVISVVGWLPSMPTTQKWIYFLNFN
jgi:hypothetical protein